MSKPKVVPAKQFWKETNHGKQSVESMKDFITKQSEGKPAPKAKK